MAGTTSPTYDVAVALEGQDCAYCAEGTLVRGVHRGNPAVVCAACETPAAQFW